MVKKIDICFLHPAVHSVDDIRRLFHFDERNYGFVFIWNDITPQYLVASECVYYDVGLLERFIALSTEKNIQIFWGGEAIAPDLNIFDYAIVFDKKLKYEDRIASMPNLLFFGYADGFKNKLENIRDIKVKEKFCNFIYSNKNAHPKRDEIFYFLSKYKKVDALGSHLNNVGNETSRFNPDWRIESIRMKEPYKFSIAAENACYKGYTSEKIMTSFLAHTVPIYWGNPDVAEEFNEEAFINCNKYKDLNELLEVIKKIDNDDELWKKMITAPWMTKEQEKMVSCQTEQYFLFLKNIFGQDIEEAKRVPQGTAVDIYRNFVFNKKDKEPLKLEKIRYRINGILNKIIRKI